MEGETYSSKSRPRLSRIAGIAGITASTVCAVHCMALPALSAIFLMAGIGFRAQAGIELVLTVSSLALAGLVFVPPAWRGGDPFFLQLAILASAFFLAGWLGSGMSAALRQSFLMSSSALLLVAHAGNFRRLRREASGEDCALHSANCRP